MRAIGKFWKTTPWLLWAAALVLAVPAAAKDVLFASTPQVVVDAMLMMEEVDASDHVVDLGSGDGRIPIAAAKRHGASAVGIDIVQRYQNAVAIGEVGQAAFQGSGFTGRGQLRGERFSLVLDRPAAEMWESPLEHTWRSPLEFDLRVRGDWMEGEARIGGNRVVLKAEHSKVR